MPTVFPKLSAPLVKDIRTGEGIAEWLLGLGSFAVAATGSMSFSHAALYATIAAGIKGTRRGLVKLVALQSGAGIGTPIIPTVISDLPVEKALTDISAGIAAAAKTQSEPGVDLTAVTSGLAPSSAPVQAA